MVTDKTSQSCWRVNNGFWWFPGGARDARTSAMRHLRGQEGARKALGGHREGRALVYPPVVLGSFRDACLAWGIYRPMKRRSFIPLPGNGFFSKNRILGLTSTSRLARIFTKEGQMP